MAQPTVIDISHYQSTPDFAALKAGGVLGVILKATEGTGYTDPTFRPRYDAAIKAGLAVSSYHFLKHGNVQAQMDYYLSVLKPRFGERVVIDYEDSACTLDDLRAAITYLQSDFGELQITVYGANGFLGAQLKGRNDAVLAKTALWVASYTSASSPTTTDLRGTWPNWSLWQYTDKATVAGLSGACDGNRFNGSNDNLLKWLNPVPSTPVPEPPEAPLVITLTVDCDVPVKIIVKGSANAEIATA